MKNTFAPINQLCPEVLSLIPGYCNTDKELIKSTHVCHFWREVFISCASLWTFLDCRNLSQTYTYLERSKKSPLEICLRGGHTPFLNGAFLQTVPHISRLRALTFSGPSHQFFKLTKQLGSTAPLLKKLDLSVQGTPTAPPNILFDGDLPSLHKLYLANVLIDLPWKNPTNLTELHLYQAPHNVTQLLNLFRHAPLLHEIILEDSLPDTSDAPSDQVVPLPNLGLLNVVAQPAHSILLNHLHIPAGAMVSTSFEFSGEASPILDCLPRSLDNLSNLSHITAIRFELGQTIAMGFKGPSGSLYMAGSLVERNTIPPTLSHQLLLSLNRFHISTAEKLMIGCFVDLTHLGEESSSIYQIFLLMNNLCTLTLVDCINIPFIFALDPNYNSSNTVLCPKLEGLVLYGRKLDDFDLDELLEMAKQRSSKGAKLATLVIICEYNIIPAEKVFDLRRCVSHVEHKLGSHFPRWDLVPSRIHELDCDDEW